MADKKTGYIKVYRSMQEHWLWKNEEPYDVRSAWLDILLSVNHKENKVMIGKQVVVIKPGQMWTSYKKLGKKWNWSYKKVLRYISMLKFDGMIFVNGTPNGTLLTVINWDNFNGRGITYDTPNDTPDDTTPTTPNDTPNDIQTIMNKNGKNGKNVKKREPRPPRDGTQWQ